MSTPQVVVDPAFKVVPKTSSAFFIWRIENMTVVPVPKGEYGKFYDGDSYIIYAASERGKPAGPDIKVAEVRNASLEVHIHFWLGLETSQDEAGVAAYKTVELDEYLGGGPTQHREVQGTESSRFRSYFKNGIMLLHGGVASGMRRSLQDPESFRSRLFRVRGRRWSNTAVCQMPAISWEHMNTGDAFVLETWPALFVWTGNTSSHMEKVQAAKVAQQLRDERPAQGVDATSGVVSDNVIPIVFVEDGMENKLPEVEKRVFESHLPIKKRTAIKSANEVVDDQVDGEEDGAAVSHDALKLYHCSDEGGTLKVTEVKDGPLFQEDLDSKDSYIVDSGPTRGIWVWVGQGASTKERVEAMRNAHGFVRKKEYASHTPVTRVIDGAEPLEFRCLFKKWKLPGTVLPGTPFKSPTGRIARIPSVTQNFDVTTMHERPALAAEMQMVDDGNGKKLVWRIENMALAPVPEEMYGIFYDGDAYVVQYSYNPPGSNSERHILYFWLGLHCSQDEAGAAALLTVQKDDEEFDGAAVQVRIVQGKEPPHFLVLFSGRTIVLHGGKASKFDGENAKDTTSTPNKYLVQVHGNERYNTRATEVDFRASSLNTNDVFVLRNEENVFLWSGKGSTGDEREMAKKVAECLCKGLDITVVSEGQEKPDFWEALGGKEPYANSKVLSEAKESSPARLFQCSNATGIFKVEEVISFSQLDLVQDDVMLLDAGESIFIWIGKDSNKEERKLSTQTALQYLKTEEGERLKLRKLDGKKYLVTGDRMSGHYADPAGRDMNTSIIQIKQGFEPPNFTGFFGVWDTGLWNNHKSFEELKKEMQDSNPELVINTEITNGRGAMVDLPKYPLQVLLEKDPDKLPDTVDPTNKELHLSEEEFKSTFKMNFAEYDAFPAWKKANLKKKVGLF